MRPIGIRDQGFLRVVAATSFELDEDQTGAMQPGYAETGETGLAQVEQDLSTLHQWIDYFMQSKTMTEQEIQGLKDQVEYLESYVYDATGGTAGQDTTELENRLNLLEQQLYEGPGTPEATPAVEPPARKQAPRKRKKKTPAWEPAGVPSDAESKKWWQW